MSAAVLGNYFSKIAPNITNYLGYIRKKIFHQELFKCSMTTESWCLLGRSNNLISESNSKSKQRHVPRW